MLFRVVGAGSLLTLAVALQCGCVVDQPAADSRAANANGGLAQAPAAAARVAAANPAPALPGDGPEAATGDRAEVYLRAMAEKQSPEVRAALEKIEGAPLKLLALRGYLRGGGDFRGRWSWTEGEMREYRATPDYARALGEVEKVRRAFAEANPGYTLRVNTDARPLEKQIENWNETGSVRAAGEELMMSFREELGGPEYGAAPEGAALEKALRFVRGSRTSRAPTVAVPGLSPHGRLRAFDFQVERGGRLVAAASSASVGPVWEGQGWAAKLKEAVVRSGASLDGPLESPKEPWHYSYTP